MDFGDLEKVVMVARENNISRAAQALYISQPTLSQAVVRVEKSIGCQLFERRHQGLVITEEGRRFVKISQKILTLKDDLDREIHQITLYQSGRIHFGVSHSFSSFLLPKILPKFNQDYPNIEIIIHNETSSVLEKLLLDGSLDTAVLVLDSPNEYLKYRTLFHEQILLAVSRDNPLSLKGIKRKGKKFPFLSHKLLYHQNFILSPKGMRLRQTAETFFAANSITPDIAVTTASVETANRLAASNMGIAFIPFIFAVSPNALPGSLPSPSYFMTDKSLQEWTVVIARRRDKQPNPLTDALADALEQTVGDTPKPAEKRGLTN